MIDPSLVVENLASPPILFFMLGMAATAVRSDLAIPPQAAKFLSIYLLFSIGFHGGVELRSSGLDTQIILTLATGAIASFVFPLWSYALLRRRLNPADAAAAAACYGSISAVTFLTAVSFLESRDIAFSGHMVATMAIMESPAIIAGVMLYRRFTQEPGAAAGSLGAPMPGGWGKMVHEAMFNGAVLLLLGSLVIGALTGSEGWAALKPVVKDPFKGVLCLFLLDMGIVAAKRLGDMKRSGATVWLFALIAPLLHGMIGILLASALGLGTGDALLMAVLCGSASYIAVPAAIQMSIPMANPSIYVSMSLALTFPLNITLGIPLHMLIIQSLWGTTP
jgi:hypothetical protein